MDSSRSARTAEIFLKACELKGEARAAYLDAQCGGDVPLRNEVEGLLEHDGFSAVIDKPLIGARLRESLGAAASHPDRIGKYQILDVIGEGGMGTVYRARQSNPNRVVALKVIRSDLISKSLIRRFEYEAEVLGQLQDPGIAQIYEAGTADAGHGPQPYFALEFVAGRRLDEYSNENKLTIQSRLELLAKVCDAVHHAHQKGIIHRDLKPGNILVDSSGCPKVLDFGVARATHSDIRTITLQTHVGQLVGTLPYMSPEQVSGNPEDLDVRSDVYALGVMGYELLTGKLPHDLRDMPLPEAARTIRDDDPIRLSSLNRMFRGDIEIIISKALVKNKDHRYQSAAQLAADIRRSLNDEPIVARPASAGYQLRKFARRNRALVSLAALAAIALAGGTALATWQAFKAKRAEAKAHSNEELANKRLIEAVTARGESDAVTDFLAEMLASVNPDDLGRDVLVRDVLERASTEMAPQLKDKPVVESRLQYTLGMAFLVLGEHTNALARFDRAIEIRDKILGPDHADTLLVRHGKSRALIESGRYKEADGLSLDVLERARRVLGPRHPLTLRFLNHRGDVLEKLGQLDEAEALFVEVLEESNGIRGVDRAERLKFRADLASCYRDSGRFDEAEPIYLDLIEESRRLYGDDHTFTLAHRNNLAILYKLAGRYNESEKLYNEVVAKHVELYGPKHPATIRRLIDLGMLYMKTADYETAERIFTETLDARTELYGEKNPLTLLVESNLAEALRARGQRKEARELMENTLALQRQALGPEHPDTVGSMHNLGILYMGDDELAKAAAILRDTVALRRQLYGDEHPRTLTSISALAQALCRQGKYKEGEAMYTDLLETQRRVLGEEHPDALNAMQSLAVVYRRLKQNEKAEKMGLAAIELQSRVLGPTHPNTLSSISNLAILYKSLGRYEDAEPLFLKVLEESRRQLGDDHLQTIAAIDSLAKLRRREGRLGDAAQFFSDALDRYRVVLGDGNRLTVTTMVNLAGVLRELDRLEPARDLYREALGNRRRDLGGRNVDTIWALLSLAECERKLQRHAEAIPLYDEAIENAKAALSPDKQPAVMKMLNGRAQSLMALGRRDEAEADLLDACDIGQKSLKPDDPLLVRAIDNLIEHYESTEQSDLALSWREKLPRSEPESQDDAGAAQPQTSEEPSSSR